MRQQKYVQITNQLLTDSSIIKLKEPNFINIPLCLDNSCELELLVDVEQDVKIGQVLAKLRNTNKVIISTINGKIKTIKENAQIKNKFCMVIEIENNFSNLQNKLPILKSATAKSIKKRAIEAGINNIPTDKSDKLIVNTLENKIGFGLKKVVLKNYISEIIKGAKLVAKTTNSKQIVFAVDQQDTNLIDIINNKIISLKYKNVSVLIVKNKKSFKNLGSIINDVQALLKLYEAVNLGYFQTEKIVALGGLSLKKASYYMVKIGTPLNELIELAGGLKHTYQEIEDFKDQALMALNDEIIIKQDIKEENDLKEKEKLIKLLSEKKKEAKEKIYVNLGKNREKYSLCLANMMLLEKGSLYSVKSITNAILPKIDGVLFLSNSEFKKNRFNR